MRFRLSVIALFALLSSACERLVYHPLEAHRATANGVSLNLTKARLRADAQESVALEADLELPEALELEGAWLGSPASIACGGPVSAKAFDVDGKTHRKGPVSAGAHGLTIHFPREEAWEGPLKGASIIDLALKKDGTRSACLRVPLADNAHEQRWQPRADWYVGLGGGFRLSTTPLETIDPLLFANLQLGHRFGDAHGGVELGVGSTGSDRTLLQAGPTVGYSVFQAGKVHMALSAGYDVVYASKVPPAPPPIEPPVTKGSTGLGYAPPLDQPAWVHGPRVKLHLGFAQPELLRTGFPGGAQLSSVGLELPVSVWFSPQSTPRVMLVVGLGLGGTFAL
jgi:hypothetical protein